MTDSVPAVTQSLIEIVTRTPGAGGAQQRFQKLVAKVGRMREELQQWEDYASRHARRMSAEFTPVRTELAKKQRDMVMLIDHLLSRPEQASVLRRGDAPLLRFLLMDLLEALQTGDPDPAMDALRLKHATPEELARIKSTASVLNGRQREDRPDAEERLENEFARAERQRRDEEARRQPGGQPGFDLEDAANQALQSLREVFRKLVSALHPDRESDPAERERKNKLMQRVNKAYEENDLLTLLSLQVELGLVDAGQLSSPERIQLYNQALDAQIAHLERQSNTHRETYHPLLRNWQATIGMTPQSVDAALTRQLAKLKEALADLSNDYLMFKDPRQLHACLDDQVRAQAEELNLPAHEMDIDELRVLVGMHNEQGAARGEKRRSSGR